MQSGPQQIAWLKRLLEKDFPPEQNFTLQAWWQSNKALKEIQIRNVMYTFFTNVSLAPAICLTLVL